MTFISNAQKDRKYRQLTKETKTAENYISANGFVE